MIINTLRNYLSADMLFKCLLLSTSFFLIAFFTGDFFTVYYNFERNEYIYLDARRVFLEKYTLQLFGLVSVALISLLVISMRQSLSKYKPSIVVSSLCLALVLLTVISTAEPRGMLFFGIILTIFVFDFFIQSLNVKGREVDCKNVLFHTKTGQSIVILLATYLILPVLVYMLHFLMTGSHYFNYEFSPQLYVYDSFRGFTLDRVQYSYLAGLFLLVLLGNRNYMYYFVIPLLLGLYLAQSRAALVALTISILFYSRINDKASLRLLLLFVTTFMLVLLFFGFREDFFTDGGNRLEMLTNSFSQVIANGWKGVLFGSGEFYTLGLDNHQPHNSILQTLLNFGVIITLLWIVMLCRFYKLLSTRSKPLFIYMMVFGLFHAGFSAFVFLPITFMGYMLVLALSCPRHLQEVNSI